jgi:hypothetical protein
MMSMSLAPRLVQTQTQPATQSVFPAVERLLEDTEYQKALGYVAGRKNMDRYRSVIDFLWSELMGGRWKAACFRYYEGKGPLLKDLKVDIFDDDGKLLGRRRKITPEMLAEWEKQLCMALEVAWSDMDEERTRSWKDFRRRWQRRLAA